MKPAIPLSVVVPAYRRADETRRLLASLAASEVRFEVVLVDDASPEALEPIADPFREDLDLVVLRLPTNQGPAAARNAGIRRASHDIVGFTDNDCVVTPGWARRLHRYVNDAPPKVAGAGGRVLALGEDLFSRYYTYHKILDPWLDGGRYLYVVTANAAFRRSALEDVGGFDEGIRIPGGEDPGLCFKLLECGWRLDYDAEAVVFHDYRPGLVDFARTFFRYGAGCRHQADRHARGAVRQRAEPVLGFGGRTTSEG
jgi:GT2 family glycosyltransferase